MMRAWLVLCFQAPKWEEELLKGEGAAAEHSLPGRSLVMDTDCKELDKGFPLELWQKEVHGVRRESNLGTWGLALL